MQFAMGLVAGDDRSDLRDDAVIAVVECVRRRVVDVQCLALPPRADQVASRAQDPLLQVGRSRAPLGAQAQRVQRGSELLRLRT